MNQLIAVLLPLVGLAASTCLALPADPIDGFDWFDHQRYGSDYPAYDSSKHGTDPIASIVKRLPYEDKSFKKSAMPLLNTPYCQEINSKDSRSKCYKCKDPSNGMNYEHCSYSSQAQNDNALRGSRSNKLESTFANVDSTSAASTRSEQPAATYRFGDDYFHRRPETQSDPSELEPSASDNCKRERRDSMLCMVCRDPKTNGKYEQCSYVGGPSQHASHSDHRRHRHQKQPKARKESKSPKHTYRQEEEEVQEEEEEEEEPRELSSGSEEEEEEEDKEGHGTHNTYLGYPKFNGYDAQESSRSEKLKSSPEKGCKTAKKNGETCTVCTEPKTGAKSEKCNYSFQPKDKAYAYTKSKSFGYPESSASSPKTYKDEAAENQDDDNDEEEAGEEKAASPEKLSDGVGSAEDYSSSSYASPDYIRSESERISKKVQSKGDCREEKRDGMSCKVCRDPRSGDDFEQCSYSYDPDDKVYAYSKSKHFGSPSPSSADEYTGASDESADDEPSQPEESSYSTSVLDYLPKPSESQHSSVYSSFYTAASSPATLANKESALDGGFNDAALRRAEIEKIVSGIGNQDRSKCSKTYRAGMTCYGCKDDKGFSDEECVFVTEPAGGPDASTTTPSTTTPSTTTAGSSNATRTRRSSPDDQTERPAPLLDEEIHEAEPYDYVAETRPLYDKLLGLTLPAYMVKPSAQEMEFDQSVENSKL